MLTSSSVIVFGGLISAMTSLYAKQFKIKPFGLWSIFFLISLAVALYIEIVTPIGAVISFVYAGIGFTWYKTNGWLRGITGIFFAVTSLLIGFHVLPGFNNPILIPETVIGNASQPYKQYLNFDKAMVGLFILVFVFNNHRCSMKSWKQAFKRAVLPALLVISLVLFLGMLAGIIQFDPKISEFALTFMICNLFFTCLTEEAFFRGLIQLQINKGLKNYSWGIWAGIIITGILFGVVHLGGGVLYALISGVLGIGIGYVFHKSGRIEMAVLTHFLLNAIHFNLFTYPSV